MNISRAFAVSLVALSVLGSSALVACGNANDPKHPTITAGEMPSGETWTGVYFHPVFGYLHMIEQDGNIVARWKRTDQSAWGELSGTSTGNVLHFAWKEHKVGQYGPSADSSGKGIFIYKVNQEGIGELTGQYGLGTDEGGSDWHNVKQQRMTPDLKSINGSGDAEKPAGTEWH